jgi:hypothetical protein
MIFRQNIEQVAKSRMREPCFSLRNKGIISTLVVFVMHSGLPAALA